MQVTIRDLSGNDAGGINLPEVSEAAYRPNLIKCAVITVQANRKQPYGADPYAQLRTPAESMGNGRGISHGPRQNGIARRVPHAVSDRRAYPPRAEEGQGKEINTRERKLTVRSALAATMDPELITERGHRFDDDVELPLAVSDDSGDLVKTQEVTDLLQSLDVSDDIERSEENKKVRGGQDKFRGRKYTRPKSVLSVTADEPSKMARNLVDVDVATAANISAEDLAPDTHADRLTLFTESALEEIVER